GTAATAENAMAAMASVIAVMVNFFPAIFIRSCLAAGRKLSRIKLLTAIGGVFAKNRLNLPEKNTQSTDIPKNRLVFAG
ncbi:MAG TPA: hypothetical protein DEP46_02790, partial [Blastocatellia bacterium]|nr:hypothetical protein [Blastocatellia bacterium]